MTLVTTLGPLRSTSNHGFVLPHKHVFCDLRTYESPDYARADEAEVSAVMVPLLRQARELGVTALVEPSTVGIGRRADLLLSMIDSSTNTAHLPAWTVGPRQGDGRGERCQASAGATVNDQPDPV